MTSPALRIVFMGTPPFAVACLETLAAAGCDIVTVVTQPDRPKGRGRRLTAPPVKIVAERLGLKVIQPERLSDPAAAAALCAAAADVFIVVAYGQILSPALLALPRLGAVNVHASLLPRYRGPAPINWAIIHRESQTGVTTMQMDPGLDTGPILLSAATPIGAEETAATLYQRLARMGAELLVTTLARLAAGDLASTPQDDAAATYARLLVKTDGRIDWTRSAADIDALVRGVNPWPGAFTHCADQRWKIWRVRPANKTLQAPAGTVIPGFSREIRVMTGQDAICIEELQGPSGKRLTAAEFLRGNPVAPGIVLKG